MKGIKLTTPDNTTYGNTKWGHNVKHSISIKKRSDQECSSGVLHYYEDIHLALLINPAHANYDPMNIWACEIPKRVGTDGLKAWAWEITTVHRKKVPAWYRDKKMRQRVQIRFALLCALAVNKNNKTYMPKIKKAVNSILRTLAKGRSPTVRQCEAEAWAAEAAARAAARAARAAEAAEARAEAAAEARAEAAARAAARAAAWAAESAAADNILDDCEKWIQERIKTLEKI